MRFISAAILSVTVLASNVQALPQETVQDLNLSSTVHLVSRIIEKDFLSETIRIGDLNGDGAPDVLFVQDEYDSRKITCLTATTIQGELLWQKGTASRDHGAIDSDLPVQIYDWDRDGHNEVLYIEQPSLGDVPTSGTRRDDNSSATLMILDGRNGTERSRVALPARADDSFQFVDLTGRGHRGDLLVKDRYSEMWAVSHEGNVLWHYSGSPGHFPAAADLDNDGRDEIFCGFALIDHDGKVLFEHDSKGAHSDACWVTNKPDGKWRLLFGNHGIHCLDLSGRVLWEHPLGEAQHVVGGRFRADSPLQFMVVDRTPVPTHRRDANAYAILYLYDLDGRELWKRQMNLGEWCIATRLVNWFGPGGLDCVLVYGFTAYNQTEPKPARIYDGEGRIVDEFPLPCAPMPGETKFRTDCYGMPADVWGDSRDEVILYGSRGFGVYANTRPFEEPSLYNFTLYPGH